VLIRDLADDDIDALVEIYGHHVHQGFGTFEEVPPSGDEMATRVAAVRAAGLPWLAAEEDGRLSGYAYASAFRPRSAYRYTAEDSVYVAPWAHGRGVGRALLGELLARCQGLGLRQMLAVIGDSGNVASIALHRSLGFETIGIARDIGFKHGRWLDVVWMQRSLVDPAGI
jgi:phosphinothricin acetyltransferase